MNAVNYVIIFRSSLHHNPLPAAEGPENRERPLALAAGFGEIMGKANHSKPAAYGKGAGKAEGRSFAFKSGFGDP